MIDAKGEVLYKEMMELLCPKDNILTKAQEYAMEVFDRYMNGLNKTNGMLYGKHGEVLMEC